MLTSNSKQNFKEALTLFPGGVNSPVRAFGSVGGTPRFIKKGLGSKVWDEDNNEYIDFVGGFGPAILGHSHPDVVRAVQEQASLGFSYGAPTCLETELARLVKEAFSSIERLRFVSSGTEACMSAIRVARGFTNKEGLIKFEGNYHGHADMLLAKAGSGAATFGISGSAGVPHDAVKNTHLAIYNNLESVETIFKKSPHDIAAVIVEPICGNAGFIRGEIGFLKGLRRLCDQYGALLIFDEVMTGFRVDFGGVQTLTGVRPDLTTLGKIVGGGMPLALYGGRQDIMDCLAPLGPVYQAGTLSGCPMATAAGIATLSLLKLHKPYPTLQDLSQKLCDGLMKIAVNYNIPFTCDYEGGMFGFFFSKHPVVNYHDAQQNDSAMFAAFFQGMLDEGVYFAPSSYEAGFISSAHTEQQIEKVLIAAKTVMAKL
jgi:glutamate-1-semialdehyde 2,1-aminomutase